MSYMSNDAFLAGVGVQELGLGEIDLIFGGKESITNIITGVGGIGAGAATIGGGLELTGLAAGLVIGGGAVVAAAGVGLLAYGIYSLVTE
jgi:hypothetical protein